MKSIYHYLTVAVLVSMLVACVNTNISLPEEFWQNKSQKIIVVSTRSPLPKNTQHRQPISFEAAIDSITYYKMREELANFDMNWYHHLANEFVLKLRKNKISASLYPYAFPYDKSNNARFALQTGNDKILVVKLLAIGRKRAIPNKAYCILQGELINLDNKVIWRQTIATQFPIYGEWDQFPSYPNLTRALHLAIESAKQKLLDSFFLRIKK